MVKEFATIYMGSPQAKHKCLSYGHTTESRVGYRLGTLYRVGAANYVNLARGRAGARAGGLVRPVPLTAAPAPAPAIAAQSGGPGPVIQWGYPVGRPFLWRRIFNGLKTAYGAAAFQSGRAKPPEIGIFPIPRRILSAATSGRG